MKQTAVEWLEEQLNPDMKTMQGIIIQELLEQAKEMEKEQIIDAFLNGDDLSHLSFKEQDELAETYYTETFGNKQNSIEETEYLLSGKNGERIKESIEQLEKEEDENELKIRLGQGIADILYENNGSSAGALAVMRYLTDSFTIKRK